MGRVLAFLYGVMSYVVFLAVFLYAIGFVGNLLVPKSIDSGAAAPSLPGRSSIDVLLLGAVRGPAQRHGAPGFKRWWTRIVPKPIERSTYVLLASLAAARCSSGSGGRSPRLVWEVESPAAAMAPLGALLAGLADRASSTFLINHFDLFGLRQVSSTCAAGRTPHLAFATPWLYRLVRHPIMLGFLHRLLGDAAHDRRAPAVRGRDDGLHLHRATVRGAGSRDVHGEAYKEYKKKVPMIVPLSGGSKG